MGRSEEPARPAVPEGVGGDLDAMLAAGTVEVARPTWRSGAGLAAALIAGAGVACVTVVPVIRWIVDSGALVVVFGQLSFLVLDLAQHR